jgi:putative membrane protein
MRVLTKWIICCGAIFLAQAVFPQSANIYGEIINRSGRGTVLWLINLFIRPIAQLLSIVFTLINLRLFSIVVNTGMVCLAEHVGSG